MPERTPSRDIRLEESLATTAAILEAAADGILTIDPLGRIESANGAAIRMFGYAREDLIGENVNALMPSPYREEHDGYLERYSRTGEARIIGIGREVQGRRRNGSVFPLRLSVGVAVLRDRRIFTGIVHDLSERRDLEAAERESAARTQAIVEAAVDAIATIDSHGSVESVNPALERLFGYSQDELIGRNVKLLMPEPYSIEHDAYLAAYRKTGERKIIGIGREVEGRRKDGSVFPMYLSVSEVQIGRRRLFAGNMHDLTYRKHLEEQVLRSQKLEAIGTLAGGVAHDFNNLLTSILGSAELALRHAKPRTPLARSLDRIVLASIRGEALTKQLLAFSRKQVTKPEVIDLNGAVREARELFERMIGEDIAVKLDLDDEAGAIRIDPGQLDHVIINLVVNARDAMPEGGELRLATGRELLTQARAEALGLRAGAYATLAIRDTGSGIPEDIRQRIFEPFFTTKDSRRGTGLGLSTVLGILASHGGTVDLHSKLGCGTTFQIYLPRLSEPAPVAGAAPTPKHARGSASASLLLVEDDMLMRDLMREVLELEGHRVLCAETPDAALELAAGASIDLVITDVVMPGMTGFELVRSLRNAGRSPRVIFMSGYTDQVLADRGELGPDDAFLRKPFSIDALGEKVAQTLSAAPRNGR